jgi:hypothetical protein
VRRCYALHALPPSTAAKSVEKEEEEEKENKEEEEEEENLGGRKGEEEFKKTEKVEEIKNREKDKTTNIRTRRMKPQPFKDTRCRTAIRYPVRIKIWKLRCPASASPSSTKGKPRVSRVSMMDAK